jgi:chemotaxis protein methyltransferase CheR
LAVLGIRAYDREVAAWRTAAFEPDGCLRAEFRAGVTFVLQDIREGMPPGPFHLIFCRNLAFTYFAEDVQRRIAEDLHARLLSGAFWCLESMSLLQASFV